MITAPAAELRITVLLGGSEAAPLLQALVPLVAGRQAEVTGLFVEDDELLRLAALPFSQELCRLTLAERALDPAALEQQFRIQARLARRALETAVGLERARRSFRSARGTLSSLLRREAEGVDLLVFGPSGAARRFVPGPASSPAVRPEPGAVVVACTDSPAGKRAVAIAEQLASAGRRRLDVLVMAEDEERARALVANWRDTLRSRPLSCRALNRRDPETLVAAARGAGTLVLEALPELLQGYGLRDLRHGLACPVLLVR
jgi:hypothetical protein